MKNQLTRDIFRKLTAYITIFSFMWSNCAWAIGPLQIIEEDFQSSSARTYVRKKIGVIDPGVILDGNVHNIFDTFQLPSGSGVVFRGGPDAQAIFNRFYDKDPVHLSGTTQSESLTSMVFANPGGLNLENAEFKNISSLTLVAGGIAKTDQGLAYGVHQGAISLHKTIFEEDNNLKALALAGRTIQLSQSVLSVPERIDLTTGQHIGGIEGKKALEHPTAYVAEQADDALLSHSILIDPITILRSKNIHFRSFDEEAPIYALGLLESTEEDIRIHAKGDVYLHNLISAKNLHIETTGRVFLGDQAWIGGKVKIKAKDIHIEKGLSSIGKTSLRASHSLNVQGNISSEDGISFKGKDALHLNGTIAAKGKLKAKSAGDVRQEGFLYSAIGLDVKGKSFSKRGTILSEGSISISTKEDIKNQEGNINSLAASSFFSEKGKIINQGGITSEENIIFDAPQAINYGVVESQGLLTGKNFFNQEKGQITAKSLSHPLAVLTRNEGIVNVNDDLILKTQAAVLRGNIKIQGAFKASGEKLTLNGQLSAQKGTYFNLDAFTNKGKLGAFGAGLQGKVGLFTNEGKLDVSHVSATLNNTKNLEKGVIRTKGHFILQGEHYENKGKVFTAGTHQASLKGTYTDSGTFYSPSFFLLNAKEINYLNGHTSYLKDGIISSSSYFFAGERVAHYLQNNREKCFLQLNSQGDLDYKGVIKQTSSRFPLLDYYKIFNEESPVIYQEIADDIYSLSQDSWETFKPKESGIVLIAGGDIRCEKSTIDPESGSVSLITEGKLHTDKAKIKAGYFQGNNALAKAKEGFLNKTTLQSLFGTTSVFIKNYLHLKDSDILGGQYTEVKAGSLKMDGSLVKSHIGKTDIQVEEKARFNHATVQGKTSATISSREAKANNIKIQSEGKSSFHTEKSAKIKAMTLSGQRAVLDIGKNMRFSMSELVGEYNQVSAQNIKSDSLSTQGITVVKAKEKCDLNDLNSQGTFVARAKEMSLSHAIKGKNLDFEADHLKNTGDVYAQDNLRMKGKIFKQLGTTESKGNSHLEATENYVDTKDSRNEAGGNLALVAENNQDFQGSQKADVLDIKLRDMNLIKLLNQTEAEVTKVHLKEGEVKIDEDFALKTNLHLWAKKLENKAKLTGTDFIAHIETTILNQGVMNFHGKAFFKATQGITNTETGEISATQGLGFETEGTFTHKGVGASEKGLLSVKAKRIDADAEVHNYHEVTSPNTSTRKARFVIPSFSAKNVRLESESSLNLKGAQLSAQENMDLIAKEDIHLDAIAYAEGDQEIKINLLPNLRITVTTDPHNKYLQGALTAGGNIRAKTAGKLDARGLKANTGGSIVLQADQGVDLSSLAAVSVVERWNYNTGVVGQNNHRGFREDAEFYRTELNSHGGGIYVLAKEGGITARGTAFQAQGEIRLDARDTVDVASLKATVRYESHDEDQFMCFGSSDDKSGSTERFRQMQALSNKKIGIFSRQGKIEGDASFMKAPEIELDGEKGIIFKPLEIHSQEETHHYENNLTPNLDSLEFEHKEKHTHTKSMQQLAGTFQTDHVKIRTGQGTKAELTADVYGLTQEAADITADTDELAISGIKSTYDSTMDAWSVKVSMSVNMTPGAGFEVSHEKLHKTNYGATVQKFGVFHNKRKGAILRVQGGAQTSINETTGEDVEAVVDKNAQNKDSREGHEFGASASSTGGSAHFSAKGGELVEQDNTTGLKIKKQTNNVHRKDIEHETKDTRWSVGMGVSVDKNGKISANANAEVAGHKIGGNIPTDQGSLQKLNPVESFKSMEMPKNLDSLNKMTQGVANLNKTVNDLGIDTGDVGKGINTANRITQTATQVQKNLDQFQNAIHADSFLQTLDQGHDALAQMNTTAQAAGVNTGPLHDVIQTSQSVKKTAKNTQKLTEGIEEKFKPKEMFRCARTSLVFLAGEIPVLERVKPAHQKSSLGLMEVTT